jgi:uncharacterized protein (DUF2249 family)
LTKKLIWIKARAAAARYLVAVMSNKVVTLDIREVIQRGQEPFGRIMQTVGALKENEDLLLIAPFEPKPLYGVLGQQGFAHEAKSAADGDWEVRFSRNVKGPADLPGKRALQASTGPENHAACQGTPTVEVDARGLEPPQPLVTILEALANLPDRARLRALTDRRPMHLYAQLEERGFTGTSEEQTDGSFVTYVQRR